MTVWSSTYQHLLVLSAQAHPTDFLEVFQACQKLVLDLELHLHAERRTLLDCERFAFERFHGAGSPQVDDNVWTAFDFEPEREDDAFAWVVGVGNVFALAEAEGGFPLLEGLVVLVCCRYISLGNIA
jgi:hypothetical protein